MLLVPFPSRVQPEVNPVSVIVSDGWRDMVSQLYSQSFLVFLQYVLMLIFEPIF